MNAEAGKTPQEPLWQRRYVELLTLLALLFVLQVSLVPFDFAADADGRAIGGRAYFDRSVDHLTFADITANIFLYVPLAALLFWSLRRALHSMLLSAPLALILAAALSAGIEHIQYFSPSRVSSLIDLVSNIGGAAIGVVAAVLCGALIPRMMEAVTFEFIERPRAALVKCYVVVLVVLGALPFSFSFDSNRLKESIKAVNYVPFATASWSDADAKVPVMASARQARAYQRWAAMKRWSRWSAECAAFCLFVWLLHPLLAVHYGFSRRATLALIWWFGACLAIALSVMQIPIVARACDVTDIVFRLLGIAVGVVIRSAGAEAKSESESESEVARSWSPGPRIAKSAIGITIAFIVYNGVIPLTFDPSKGGIRAAFSATEFLPFMAYFVARLDVMMTDVMEKFASSLVLGALLAAYWRRIEGRSLSSRVFAVVNVCVLLSCAIEIVQVFMPVRVTSLTDPILAATGAVVGVVGQARFAAFHRRVNALEMELRRETPDVREVPFGPTDELISTLTEPYEGAPSEPSPQRRRTPKT